MGCRKIGGSSSHAKWLLCDVVVVRVGMATSISEFDKDAFRSFPLKLPQAVYRKPKDFSKQQLFRMIQEACSVAKCQLYSRVCPMALTRS